MPCELAGNGPRSEPSRKPPSVTAPVRRSTSILVRPRAGAMMATVAATSAGFDGRWVQRRINLPIRADAPEPHFTAAACSGDGLSEAPVWPSGATKGVQTLRAKETRRRLVPMALC